LEGLNLIESTNIILGTKNIFPTSNKKFNYKTKNMIALESMSEEENPFH